MSSFVARAKRHPLLTLVVVEVVFFASTSVFLTYGNLVVPSLSQVSFRLIATPVMAVFALALIAWFGWTHETGIDTLGRQWRLLIPVFVVMCIPWGAGFALPSYHLSDAVTLTGVSAGGFVLVAYLLTGVGEELLHRGFELRLLEPRGQRYAVLVTSVFFGLAHLTRLLDSTPFLVGFQVAFAVMFGVAFGALRFHLGSVWPLVLAHAFGDIVINTAVAANEGLARPLELLSYVLLFVYGIYLLRKLPVDEASSRPTAPETRVESS